MNSTFLQRDDNVITNIDKLEKEIKAELITELIRTRNKLGVSQKKLEILSGVKQPIIARIEKGYVSPNISTLLKLLVPLGKTLYIDDLYEND